MRKRCLGFTLLSVLAVGARADEPSAWKYASVPGFEIYSDVPESATQNLLHDFLLVHYDFQRVWPTPQIKNAATGRIILCDQPAEFQEFNPGTDQKLNVVPVANSSGRGPPMEFKGFNPDANFMPPTATSGELNVMINYRLRMPSAIRAGGYSPWVDFFGNNFLQKDYSKYFLTLMGERVPPWLSQGLGKLVQGMDCTENSIEFPPLTTDKTLATPGRQQGSEASLQAAIRNGSFMTLEALFATTEAPAPEHAITRGVAVGRNGYYLVGPNNRDFWYQLPFGTFLDESYEFTQFCLFGEHGKYRAAFIRFALAASNGPLDEAGFQNLFGVNYHDMLVALWRYTEIGKYLSYSTSNRAGLPPVPPVTFRPATKAEIDAMRANWLAELHKPRAPNPNRPPNANHGTVPPALNNHP